MIFASLPYRIMADFQIPLYDRIRERDAEFYRKLEEAGFHARLRRRRLGPVHEVPAPRFRLLHRRRRLRLVIDGKLKLQSGKEISHLTRTP